MISLNSTTRSLAFSSISNSQKEKRGKLMFEHKMHLVIAQLNLVMAQLPVKSLWRSVRALKRRIRISEVL